MREAVVKVLVGILRIYQVTVSPLLGPRCRFQPSCSQYMMEAIKKRGPVKGVLMGVARILKCHPFHPGGYDPVG
ncbi:MAG: membrane protein insertion efficiency factor YidD [Planctomycetota bacterium]|jgi:putative membrane protein insertion efficiency factor